MQDMATLLCHEDVLVGASDNLLVKGTYLDVALNTVRLSRREQRNEQAQAATLEDLIAIGRRRGMKSPHGWARHVMAARSLRSGKASVRRVLA